MTDAAWAEIVSAVALAIVTALLVFWPRKAVRVVASETATLAPPPGGGATPVTLDKGAAVPAGATLSSGTTEEKSFSAMRQLVIGADNRTSTSKTIALAWTYAVVFGLFAVLVARWLGDERAYSSLVANGVREEYWLLLGGPYAAAVAAKYAATTQNQGSGKPEGPIGGATVGQLVANDEGSGDLGDFQYVVFNALTLAFYLGRFIPHLNDGLPHLPAVLTGLALTSAGVYSAKKFLQQAPPTLTSVVPASVKASTPANPAGGVAARVSTVEVWGSNLIVPASVAPGGVALPPTVLIGGVTASVTGAQQTMGADHLTVQVPDTLPAPAAGGTLVKVTAVRGDGVAATGPGGTDSLQLTLTP